MTREEVINLLYEMLYLSGMGGGKAGSLRMAEEITDALIKRNVLAVTFVDVPE